MPQVKPEILSVDECLSIATRMEEDAKYRVSKNIKDPKIKRQNKSVFDWASSLKHHFTEYRKLLNR